MEHSLQTKEEFAMRRLVAIPSAALFLGIATMVLAASNRHVTADFTPLASNGISGNVVITESPQGGTNLRLQLKGLQPGTDYVSQHFTSQSCQFEAPSDQNLVATFRPNPSGMAIVTTKLGVDLTQIGSNSVRPVSDQTVSACATIPQ